MKLPKRYAYILFGLIMSGIVALIVSGALTVERVGLAPGWWHIWFSNYLLAWAVAFPSVSLFAPITRRLVARFTTD